MTSTIIGAYHDFLKNDDIADNTIKRYLRAVNHFSLFYEDFYKEQIEFRKVLPGELQEWKRYMQEILQYSDSTTNNYIECIRRFFKFLVDTHVIDISPADRIKCIKIQNTHTVRWLDEREETNLCFIVDNSKDLWNSEWLFERNRTAFYLMLKAGLRISEVAALNVTDIENGFISIRHSKGQKSRNVYMSKDLAKIYANYLPVRTQRLNEGKVRATAKQALFFGERGNRITTSGLAKVMKEIAEISNIENLTAHTLRHTLAHNLVVAGASLVEVADILGHDSLQTTRIYTTSSAHEQANIIEKANNK